MEKHYIGIDIGGTKIEVVLLSNRQGSTSVEKYHFNGSDFFLIDRQRILTQRDKGYDVSFQNLINLLSELCSSHGLLVNDISGIGIGVPGSVDPQTNMILNANSEIFVGKDLTYEIANALSFEGIIVCDNDANLFALAETFLGAGTKIVKDPGTMTSIGIILGTGCGGGIIINGKLLQGPRGGGGEIGHTQLVSDGELCYCGRRGCAEMYLSGTGIEFNYEKINGNKLSAPEIFALYDQGEVEATKTLALYKSQLSTFLINLTNIFDPDMIVLGGGVSNQVAIYDSLEKNIHELSFIPNHPVKVCQNVLGDSAGVLGAALLPVLKMNEAMEK